MEKPSKCKCECHTKGFRQCSDCYCKGFLDDIKQKIDNLYGELVRCQFGAHTKLGEVVLDIEKIKDRIYEIKCLIDEEAENEKE